MGFFDAVSDFFKGQIDDINKKTERARRIQQDKMLNKSDDELREIVKEGGMNAFAASLELRDRGYGK